jgi:putative flippase GtrA
MVPDDRSGKMTVALLGRLGRLPTFALVGAAATALQYLGLYLLVELAGSNPVLASAAGFVISAVVNYLLNYRFTFRSSAPHGPALMRFMTVATVGLVMNSAAMHALVSAGVQYLIAQMIATGIVLLCNFAAHAIWTFGGSRRRIT